MTLQNPQTTAPVLVICLCAQWCGVCRDYQSRFAQVELKFPQVKFLWIDIEDEADLLHPLDVEDFPTLLLAVGDEPRFFGPLTPQPETLERLIQATLRDGGIPVSANPEVTALLHRLLKRV
jgi:thioredoxin 1